MLHRTAAPPALDPKEHVQLTALAKPTKKGTPEPLGLLLIVASRHAEMHEEPTEEELQALNKLQAAVRKRNARRRGKSEGAPVEL